MIDLHTHSILSDGELLPSELIRRAKVRGYTIIGISDHVDGTNIEQVISSLLKIRQRARQYAGITVLPGIEITHVPAVLIGETITLARKLGAYHVVVHGETLSEPVEPGTNREAILAGADILAHPGLILEDEVILAKERGVLLEISGRKGHSLANGHVARLAKRMGAKMIFDTDSHAPSDLVTKDEAQRVVLGAGLSPDDFTAMQKNAEELTQRAIQQYETYHS